MHGVANLLLALNYDADYRPTYTGWPGHRKADGMRINIVNSLHPHAIGDGLSAFPMLWKLSNIEPVSVYFSCAAIRPLCTFAETFDEPLDGITLDIQEFAAAAEARGLHLAQSWYWRLGIDPPNPPFAWPRLPAEEWLHRFDIVFAPFSGSDFDGSKTWPLARWLQLSTELNPLKIVLLCGGTEKTDGFNEHVTDMIRGRDLREVCGILRSAKIVLTIDNGIGWLAQAMGCQHVLLQPSNYRPTWTCNPNHNAINLPIAANIELVCDYLRSVCDGKPIPRQPTVAIDPRAVRAALRDVYRFLAVGDREAALANLRLWHERATPAQYFLVCCDVLAGFRRMLWRRMSRSCSRSLAAIWRRHDGR